MPILLLDPGTSHTGAVAGWSGTNGTVTSSTDLTDLTPRVLKFAGAAPYVYADWTADINAGRISVYLNLADLPAETTRILNPNLGVTSNARLGLQITTGGVLQFTDGGTGGAQIGGNGATLAPDTWYRICIAFAAASTTSFTLKCWVDDTLSITATNADGTLAEAAAFNRWLLGPRDTSTPVVVYATNIYIDDVSGLTDPGNVRVTAKRPTTITQDNWTAVGGGAVNERPINESAYVHRTGSQIAQAYAIEAAADGDVDLTTATIVGFGGWAWAQCDVAGAGAALIVNAETTNITLTTSPAYYAAYVVQGTYPGAASTIGLVSKGADDTFLYECGVLIVYIPGAPPAEGGGWLRYRK